MHKLCSGGLSFTTDVYILSSGDPDEHVPTGHGGGADHEETGTENQKGMWDTVSVFCQI